MHTAAIASNLLENANSFSSDDLETMRHAYRRACDENPSITTTAAQRYSLARAIVSRFERSLSETDLIAAAFGQAY